MGSYAHFDGVSSRANGYAVGAKGSERKVINASGQMYIPGDAATASTVASSVTATGSATAVTATTTLTKPAIVGYKIKAVGKGSPTTVNILVNGAVVSSSTSITGSASPAITFTGTAPLDQSATVKAQAKIGTAAAITASIASIKTNVWNLVYLPTVS
jgi:hypothetical protein